MTRHQSFCYLVPTFCSLYYYHLAGFAAVFYLVFLSLREGVRFRSQEIEVGRIDRYLELGEGGSEFERADRGFELLSLVLNQQKKRNMLGV